MMRFCSRRLGSALAAALLLALGAPVLADDDFEGTITRIFDGDSFLVRGASGKDIDVRLADIDAPEKQQPYGNDARAALKKLIDGRRVYVDVIETDQYDRKVARVYRLPDRLDVRRSLVHDGHVWVWRKHARDRELFALEDAARASHVGIWALPESQRMPPWKFRYLERQKKSAAASEQR